MIKLRINWFNHNIIQERFTIPPTRYAVEPNSCKSNLKIIQIRISGGISEQITNCDPNTSCRRDCYYMYVNRTMSCLPQKCDAIILTFTEDACISVFPQKIDRMEHNFDEIWKKKQNLQNIIEIKRIHEYQAQDFIHVQYFGTGLLIVDYTLYTLQNFIVYSIAHNYSQLKTTAMDTGPQSLKRRTHVSGNGKPTVQCKSM